MARHAPITRPRCTDALARTVTEPLSKTDLAWPPGDNGTLGTVPVAALHVELERPVHSPQQ